MKNEIPTYAYKNLKNNLEFEIQSLDFFIRNTRPEQVGIHHRIDFYCILFIIEGNGRHIINFEQYDYEPGAILFMAKNQVVAFKLKKETEGYILFFKDEFLQQNKVQFNDLSYSFPFNFGLYTPIIRTELDTFSFEQFFALVYREFRAPRSPKTVEIIQCFLRIILLKVSVYGNRSELWNNDVSKSEVSSFLKFQQLLDRPDTCSRNAENFCQDLGIAYRQLNSLCKRLTGKTLKTFIDDSLILKAKRMLIYSNSNISEIAFSLGFEEITNFTKYFKKHTSKTPTEFQKENN